MKRGLFWGWNRKSQPDDFLFFVVLHSRAAAGALLCVVGSSDVDTVALLLLLIGVGSVDKALLDVPVKFTTAMFSYFKKRNGWFRKWRPTAPD